MGKLSRLFALLAFVFALSTSNAYASDSYVAVAKRYGASPDCISWLTHCVRIESGGNPRALNSSGHAGILQFSNDWGTLEQRFSVEWSVRVFVKGYDAYGIQWVKRHWCKWHHCSNQPSVGYTRKSGGSRATSVPRVLRSKERRLLALRKAAALRDRYITSKLGRLESRDFADSRMALPADAGVAPAPFCSSCHGLDRFPRE